MDDLYDLLKKNTRWKWLKSHETAFNAVKKLLKCSDILIHFNPEVPVELMYDTSSFRLGAVLTLRLPNGNVKSIAFASKTLNSSQKNYSLIDLKALAIIFRVRKFHQ